MSATVVEVPVTRYRCSVCHRGWSTRSPALIHVEEGCPLDPGTHHCRTCVFLGVDMPEPDVGIPGGPFCSNEHGPILRDRGTYVFDCALWQYRRAEG